jgi:hypothetical protein
VQQPLERDDDHAMPLNDQVMATPKATRTQSAVVTPSPVPGPTLGDAGVESEAVGVTQQPSSTPARLPAGDDEQAEQGEDVSAGAAVGEDVMTPKAKQVKKRLRVDEEEPGVEMGVSSPQDDRPSTPVDDVHVRRKRIRR